MDGRSYSGGNGGMDDLITSRTRVTKLPSSTTSIDDAVGDMAMVMASAGMAAVCGAYTIKQKRGAEFVNAALAENLASVATAVAMAGQSVRVALEERKAADAGAGSYSPFPRWNALVDPSKATRGAHTARTAVAGFRKHNGWLSNKLQRGLVSSSAPATLMQIWLWWPLAWLWHWIWAGRSAMASDLPPCGIHKLWASAMKAGRTATAAADDLCGQVAAKEKSKAKTTTVVKHGRLTPYANWNGNTSSSAGLVKLYLPGIDAHDIQQLRTAAALADAAAFVAHNLASSALGASNPRQARRAARVSRDAAAAALRAEAAYTSILYKIESLSDDTDREGGEGGSVYNDDRRYADALEKWCRAMDILQSPSADITAIDNPLYNTRSRSERHFYRLWDTMAMFFTIEFAVEKTHDGLRRPGSIMVIDGPGDNNDNDNGDVKGEEDDLNGKEMDAHDESLPDSISSAAGSSEALLT